MNYIGMAMEVFPIVFIITSIIYFTIIKGKNINLKERKKVKILSEFALIGFFTMFIYVTQIMSFGNDMGKGMNWIPLEAFYIAGKYGIDNASMIGQIMLNIVMCIPLGILLPIVFPGKFKNYLTVFLVSFGLTVSTETLQYFVGRSADIDDIIANTIGGLIGFGIYILFYGVYSLVKGKKVDIKNYKLKIFGTVLIFIITYSPFIVVNIMEGQSKYGHVYYGHMTPEEIILNSEISDGEIEAPVYKICREETQEELAERILKASGFKNAELKKEYDDTITYFEGDDKVIFIFSDNTWSVTYEYAKNYNVNKNQLPNEEEAIGLAEKYLKNFNIDTDKLEYKGIQEDYGDDNLHLAFEEKVYDNSDIKVMNEIMVTIGEDGKLVDITDYRVKGKLYDNVQTISPIKSLEIAQDVGVGEYPGKAYIDKVELTYYYQEERGYIIPVWKIIGMLDAGNGNKMEWYPEVEASK